MKKLFLLTLILFTTLLSNAQIVSDPTTWSFESKHLDGDNYNLIFKVKIKDDYHIYSFNPGGDGMQIIPSFTFNKNPNLLLKGKVVESGKKITENIPEVGGDVYYFKNSVVYTQKAEIKSDTKVTGKYRYQMCNDQGCLSPVTKSFTFDIKTGKTASVTEGGSMDTSTIAVATTDGLTVTDSNTIAGVDTSVKTVSTSNEDTTKTAVVTSAKSGDQSGGMGIASDDLAKASLLNIFIAGLVAGLAAVVTPCIYSMIPITVSFFTKKSKDRATGIKNAIIYSLSIIVIFAVLGVGIIAIFGGNALNNLSTNWIANLFFFAIFLLFGLSFLGAFELTLPSAWTNKVNSKANTNSFGGIFFMALTLVIVSFSCTSAFIGGIAVLASKGGMMGPIVGFSSFGLGIALPFTLFALFPSYLQNLEKPGGWQNAVKVTLGFLELGLALKFLSNADLSKGWRLLDREIFIAIWIILAILLGLYLLGKLRFSHDSPLPNNMFQIPYISIPRLLLATGAFAFAVYLIPGMFGAPLKAVSSFVPPMGTFESFIGGSSAPSHGSTSVNGPRPVKWVDKLTMYEPEVAKKYGLVTYFDLEEGIAAAKELKKPIMLDFTGINCINCRKMEGQVWSDPEVMKRLKEDFVVISLYCDFDNVDLPKSEQYYSKVLASNIVTVGDKNEDYQATKFGSNTQPFYFFVDTEDNLLYPTGYQYDPSIPKFIERLDAAKAKYKELHP